jgi:hypothetical protein
MAVIPTIIFWQDGFNYAVAVKQLSKVPYLLNTDTYRIPLAQYTRKGKLDLSNTQTCVASIASRMLRNKLVQIFEATFDFFL